MSSPDIPDDPDCPMIFDGVRNACPAPVRLVGAPDRRAELIRFAPVQSAVGRARCQRHSADPPTFLFFAEGKRSRRHITLAAATRAADPCSGEEIDEPCRFRVVVAHAWTGLLFAYRGHLA